MGSVWVGAGRNWPAPGGSSRCLASHSRQSGRRHGALPTDRSGSGRHVMALKRAAWAGPLALAALAVALVVAVVVARERPQTTARSAAPPPAVFGIQPPQSPRVPF